MRAAPTILIADDEPLLLNLAGRILQDAGFRVLLTRDGAECLETYRMAAPEEISLVILDYEMPRLDGVKTLRALRELTPNLPVIISTGTAVGAGMSHLAEAPFSGAIPKPYTSERFLSEVHAVLQKSGRDRVR